MREKLKLHCDVISGYAFSSSDWKEEGIPVIKIGNIVMVVILTAMSCNMWTNSFGIS